MIDTTATIDHAADTALGAVGELLATEGLEFTRDRSHHHRLTSPGDLVWITYAPTGWRISWACDWAAAAGTGVTLPLHAEFGTVVDLAAALYARAVR